MKKMAFGLIFLILFTAGWMIQTNQNNFPATLTGTGLVRNTGASTELSGDVTTSGSNAATVVQVEGAAIPASAVAIGTNGSKQLVAYSPSNQYSGGCTSNTPTGTQFCSLIGHVAVGAGANGSPILVSQAITVTAIYASVINAEGAAATLQFQLVSCTSTTCAAVAAVSGVTCTIGNSASTCDTTGLSVAVSAGTLLSVETVQTGTGTASVSNASIAWY